MNGAKYCPMHNTTFSDYCSKCDDEDPMEEFGPPLAANDDSYPDDNPKTRFGLEKIPLHLVPPSAIHALANAFADGAQKYGPFNWREKKISATVYYAAALRHLTAWYDGEENARDSGKSHLDHALACIAMIIDGKSVGKLNDNRPPKGAAAEMQELYGLPKKRYTAADFGEVVAERCGYVFAGQYRCVKKLGHEGGHSSPLIRDGGAKGPPADQVHP